MEFSRMIVLGIVLVIVGLLAMITSVFFAFFCVLGADAGKLLLTVIGFLLSLATLVYGVVLIVTHAHG